MSVSVYSSVTLLINQTSVRLCSVQPQMSPQNQVFTETVTLRSFQLEIRGTLFLSWATELPLCVCVCVCLFVDVCVCVCVCECVCAWMCVYVVLLV